MQRKRIPVKPNIRTEVRALPIRLGRQPNGNTGDDIATRDGTVLSQPVGHTGRQMAWPLLWKLFEKLIICNRPR
jgi:hypothetical protein